MKRLTLLAIAVIVACPLWLHGQIIPATMQQTAFTNSTATSGTSPIFRNINQSSHWLTYCIDGIVTFQTVAVWLEESADGLTNWQVISPVSTTQCGVVSAGGYYFAMRARYSNLTATGTPAMFATYTASTGAISVPPNVNLNATTTPVTYVPTTGTVPLFVKSAGTSLASSSIAIYGASLYNPNSVTVYVSFAGSVTAVETAVPANSGLDLVLPPQGVLSFGPSTVNCSTSINSAVDPTTACMVNAYFKPVSNGVPN